MNRNIERSPRAFSLVAGCLLALLWIGFSPGTSFALRFTDQTSNLVPGGPFQDNTVAWGDYNNDGWPDLVTDNRIWKNNGGTLFTQESFFIGGGGYSLWGDYDRDGDLDLFTYSDHLFRVFRNDNNHTAFNTVTLPATGITWSDGASWGDWNRDGYLDLYIGGFEADLNSPGQKDVILTNNNSTFTKTWTEKGNTKKGRGVTACDFDRDGDLDIYVSNYRDESDFLWRNNGSGSFTEVADTYGFNQRTTSVLPPNLLSGYGQTIGSAWADLDNDGYFDLLQANFSHRRNNVSFVVVEDPPAFFRNMGPSGSFHFQFKDTCDVGWQESYASAAFGDYDNDGDIDLFYTTVYNPASDGIPNYARLYRNDGNWHFTDVTAAEGLSGIDLTYQAAWADFDHDGDLDLETKGKLFVNGGNPGNWLEITLRGPDSSPNENIVGAQVKISNGAGGFYTRQVEAGTARGNQNDMTIHFGLGASSPSTVSVEVRWPSPVPGGSVETISSVPINGNVIIKRGQGWSPGWTVDTPPAPITDLVATPAGCAAVNLRWTATGADGQTGTASAYDLRHSSFPITEGNFLNAATLPAPVPAPSGSLEDFTVGPLSPCGTLHYFAIKARDAGGQWSALSNVPSAQPSCCFGGGTSAKELVRRLELKGVAPNPTGRLGWVQYAVPHSLEGSHLDLAVYDVQGRRVRTIEQGRAVYGRFSRPMDAGAGALPRGIYFVRLTVGEIVETSRFAIVR